MLPPSLNLTELHLIKQLVVLILLSSKKQMNSAELIIFHMILLKIWSFNTINQFRRQIVSLSFLYSPCHQSKTKTNQKIFLENLTHQRDGNKIKNHKFQNCFIKKMKKMKIIILLTDLFATYWMVLVN
jgi:hypothetical protein